MRPYVSALLPLFCTLKSLIMVIKNLTFHKDSRVRSVVAIAKTYGITVSQNEADLIGTTARNNYKTYVLFTAHGVRCIGVTGHNDTAVRLIKSSIRFAWCVLEIHGRNVSELKRGKTVEKSVRKIAERKPVYGDIPCREVDYRESDAEKMFNAGMPGALYKKPSKRGFYKTVHANCTQEGMPTHIRAIAKLHGIKCL